ncbi:hypothetical protein JRB10_003267 [Salmonella enterica subsp. enterica serovar Kaneshie]|uniref:Uncharacterized protein n=1 Tax=Salmonella enterica TaxID=28901 RepID=A0A762B3F4_SALER|nr:hypothetical protein [Salmonella enterica subsp. enterica serovar Middlesbrough]ECQ6292127.1 hypothetical protein [Salmonella enterica subsp. enterica serovar Kaneshie]EDT3048009.1 hypothetical protein [Salmonella enterica subsp. enterica]EEB2238058.1 hypothetical protein [Salmonella enterica]ECY9929776.1 hypothetical protein [Salmonella enterica subsp. enterica serovar Kaneshie]
MSDMSNFDILTNAICSANVEIDNGYISLNFEENIDVYAMSNLLKLYGLAVEPEVENKEVVFSLSSSSFRDDSKIYSSLDTFLRKCISLRCIPHDYIILSEKISSLSFDDKIGSIDIYLKWISVLSGVANHHVSGKYILYIPSNEGGKELVITSYERLDYIIKSSYSKVANDAVEKIIKVLDVDDAQSPERKSIIRTAIYDLINTTENKDISALILVSERIFNRYNDLLELYTNRFSVNKLLSELEQKNLEYTTKINDFVSSSQTKAFAIPGSLIAIGGLAKASGFWDSLLIFIGLYLVYYITFMSNQVLDESYTSLKHSLRDSFSRYSKFDEGVEVKDAAQKILSDLYLKIDNAKDRLGKVNNIAKGMLWIGGIYLLLKIIFVGSK